MSSRAIIYIILLFLVSLVGIVRYKRLSFPFKILAWSVIMMFFAFSLDRYCVVVIHTNAPALHIQHLAEYIFYAAVYYYVFKNETVKKLIIASIIIFIIFVPINAIFLQPFLTTFPTNVDTPEQALYALFSLLLFKEMLDYPVKVNIVKQSIFWFNIAMLFFATTSFFLLGLTNYFSGVSFVENKVIFYLWWAIEYTFHILICVALLTKSKEIKTATN